MKGTGHRKGAAKGRNGRSRYEKGNALHRYEGRDPMKRRKGDCSGMNYASAGDANARLADVWPRGER